MLQVLSIYKIEFWFQLTIAILIWENMGEICLGQKYTVTFRLEGGGKDLDIGYTFRIEFSICE